MKGKNGEERKAMDERKERPWMKGKKDRRRKERKERSGMKGKKGPEG